MNQSSIRDAFLIHFKKNIRRLRELAGPASLNPLPVLSLQEIYRIFHNLASGAAMAGWAGLASLARMSEKWIQPFSAAPDPFPESARRILSDLLDVFDRLCDRIESRQDDGTDFAASIMANLSIEAGVDRGEDAEPPKIDHDRR